MVANIINHIVLVLDASGSMNSKSKQLIQVADNQIAYLAQRSKELNQETRITIYSFDDTAKCLIYDMDVLRVPSIKQLYKIGGMTAMIDATMLALNDLAMTPEKYGEHSFLIYVLTDGLENCSRTYSPVALANRIAGLPDHWTVATFVPDQRAVYEAKKFGFPAANISVWDTTAVDLSEVGTKIRETTESFMQGRAQGIRGSKNLFSMEKPSLAKVSSVLKAIDNYRLRVVTQTSRIDDFVRAMTGTEYVRGSAYYELIKREEIQPQKQIAIMDPKTLQVYTGSDARRLLGLPPQHVKVAPEDHQYAIFVQSTSDNRKLLPGQRVLIP